MFIIEYINEKTKKQFYTYIDLKNINCENKAKLYSKKMIEDLFPDEHHNMCFLSVKNIFLYEFYGKENDDTLMV